MFAFVKARYRGELSETHRADCYRIYPLKHREINHNLLVGVVTQQAAELIDVVANLPTTP